MLPADIETVRRIERAECRMLTDVADRLGAGALARPIGGGVAVHVGEDAPFNKMIGVGLDGPLDDAALAALGAIEREFDARRTPVQAEIATPADFSVPTLLARRGYEVVGFENVLARALGDAATQSTGVHVAACSAAEIDAIDAIARMRRRGVQSALLARRLADAAEAGCDVAVVTTQPGSKSQANAHRRGFSLAYVRAILRRAPTAT